MENQENVLSLFNGLGCVWLALEEAGIKVGKRYSSEIEKFPNQANDALYPDTIQLGDVRNVDVSKLEPISFLAGGSPCQSFSFAGKRKGMATKCEIEILSLEHYLELKEQNFEFEGQSYLFWEYIRILTDIRKYNPDVKFLLENVIMGSKWQKVITQAIGINPIRINAALVSAQNRNRLFWTNIYTEQDGLFGDLKCMIPQPKDEGILLKDVLETFETSNFDTQEEFDAYMKKYFLSDKMLAYLNGRKDNFNNGKINYKTEEDVASCLNASTGLDISDNIIVDTNRKARCFTAGGNSGGLHSQMDLVVHNTMPRSSKTGKGGTGSLSRTDGKTYCLDTGNTNAIEIQCVAMRGRNPDNPKSIKSGLPTEQQLEPRTDGKTNCLTSVQKDNLVMQINPSLESGGKQPYQQNRVYDSNGISPALCAHKADLLITTEVVGCDYRTDEGLRVRSNGKSGTLAARARNDESCGQLVMLNSNQRAKFNFNTDVEKSGCLTLAQGRAGSSDEYMDSVSKIAKITGVIRRLTPRECMRLQTVPEDKIDILLSCGISDTQLYKMAGNGWCIKVISHILKYL